MYAIIGFSVTIILLLSLMLRERERKKYNLLTEPFATIANVDTYWDGGKRCKNPVPKRENTITHLYAMCN